MAESKLTTRCYQSIAKNKLRNIARNNSGARHKPVKMEKLSGKGRQASSGRGQDRATGNPLNESRWTEGSDIRMRGIYFET
jgi:hypothetical protein